MTKKFKIQFVIIFIILSFSLVIAGNDTSYEQNSRESNNKNTITMTERLKSTGNTGILLLIVSIAGLSFLLERSFNLRSNKIIPNGLTQNVKILWKEQQYNSIVQLCKKKQSTFSRVIELLVENRNLKTNAVSTITGDLASREMKMHLHKSYPLAVIATISPLIGLFGTVYGMIGAFETVAIAGEMGNPAIMAESISYALMTTAIGLIIAVPALAAYHFFRTRTNIYSISLEEEASELISEWFIKRENGNESANK